MIYEATVPMRRQLKGVTLVEPAAFWPEPDVPPREPLSATPPEQNETSASPEEIEILERLQANLDELTQDLWAQQRQRLAEMQRVAIELAVAIASRLLHQRIERGELAVEGLVRQVAERLEPKEALTVYLHPTDLASIQRQGTTDPDWLPGHGKLKLAADEALGRGDCRAETGDLSLVLNLDQQLEEVRKHLLDVLPEADVEQRKELASDRPLRRYPERRHIA